MEVILVCTAKTHIKLSIPVNVQEQITLLNLHWVSPRKVMHIYISWQSPALNFIVICVILSAPQVYFKFACTAHWHGPSTTQNSGLQANIQARKAIFIASLIRSGFYKVKVSQLKVQSIIKSTISVAKIKVFLIKEDIKNKNIKICQGIQKSPKSTNNSSWVWL